jgi:hypothetical protein
MLTSAKGFAGRSMPAEWLRIATGGTMDKELARLLISAARRSSSPLYDLIPLLKQRCEGTEYDTFLKAIAEVNFEVCQQILWPIFKLFPDLEQETEDSILRSDIETQALGRQTPE